MSGASTHKANTQKRHERLRQAYRKRYTDQPRPRKHSRELVLAQLAEEFCLSVATVESILWTKAKKKELLKDVLAAIKSGNLYKVGLDPADPTRLEFT